MLLTRYGIREWMIITLAAEGGYLYWSDVKLIRGWRDQGYARWQDLPFQERDRLLCKVAQSIQAMPLWKLHTLRDRAEPFRFLYQRSGAPNSLCFETGALAFLVEFAPLIEEVVRSAWVRFVLRCNPTLLANAAGLEAFLFPAKRESLEVWRPLLHELQQACCFYCGSRIATSGGAVDHFLPWSRYPRDLGHNFVLAHEACNAAKSDHLAAPEHLTRWCRRNHDHGVVMAQRFAAANLPHDWPVLWQVAHSLYRSAALSGNGVWVAERRFVELSDDWRAILGGCRPVA